MFRVSLATALLVALTTAGATPPVRETWRPLLNGKDLSGWETFMSKPDPDRDVDIRSIREVPSAYREPSSK